MVRWECDEGARKGLRSLGVEALGGCAGGGDGRAGLVKGLAGEEEGRARLKETRRRVEEKGGGRGGS